MLGALVGNGLSSLSLVCEVSWSSAEAQVASRSNSSNLRSTFALGEIDGDVILEPATLGEDKDPVRQLDGFAHIVCHEDDRHPNFPLAPTRISEGIYQCGRHPAA